MLTGRPVDAEEALAIGLVSKVVEDGDAVHAALDMAELILRNSPFGVWMTKEVMWANLDASSFEAAAHLENRTQVLATRTADMREALHAFMEKRSPRFVNE